MTLQQFKSLDEMEQMEAIGDGKHIGEYPDIISNEKYKVAVYQLFNFYVELHYNVEHNVLRGMACSNDLETSVVKKLNIGILHG